MTKHPLEEFPGWLADQLPAGVRRSIIPVGGRAMHVMEWGSGRPVLLLHGNPTWGFLYRKVVAELAGEPLRFVVPDLIGLGFSERCGGAGLSLSASRLVSKLGSTGSSAYGARFRDA